MNNKLKYLVENLNSSFLLVSSSFFFITKFISDFLFYLIGDLYSEPAITLRILFSLLFLILLCLYLWKSYQDSKDNQETNEINRYFNDLTRIIILSISFLLLSTLIPDAISNYNDIPNIRTFLMIQVISLLSVILGAFVFFFLFRWIWFRRHKRTKFYLKSLFWFTIFSILLEIPFHYSHISSEDLAGIFVFVIVSIFLVISILLIIFLSAKKNNWIALLPKKQKLKLLFLLSMLIVIAIIVLNVSASEQGEGPVSVAIFYTFGAETMLFMSFFCFLPYLIRLLFSTLAALPTTGIVERTTSEISSLTYLNRVVAKTFEQQKLIETLTELSLQTCRGIASWTELYKEDEVEISATQYISIEHIQTLDHENILYPFLKRLNSPLLIQSISEDKVLSKLNWSILPMAKSLIAVPLFAGKIRIGTLVVLHPEEFGLEQDDLKVMQAFGDNINLALENAKLIQDSIEKERYKQELQLARDMEVKLLPSVLPEIENYSLSAFSIPAKEVGGDYYDIVTLKNGITCLLIGDVSGKGMSAAFYMAHLKGVVMAAASESKSPSELLVKINDTLYGKIEKKMYITLSAISFDDNSGNISYARAGHTPLILKNNEKISFYKPNGIGIALTSSKLFEKNIEEIKIKLTEGDVCILITDGINELRDVNDNEYGYEALKQNLKKIVFNNRADDIINALKVDLEEFLGEGALYDDMTMLVLAYHGSSNNNKGFSNE